MITNITDYLVEKSQGMLVIEPEINDWTTKNYHMANTGSVEIEVAELLYGWVKATKPTNVLDLGSHHGVSALYMAQACKENGIGGVYSIEHDTIYRDKALALWRMCGANSHIVSRLGSSLDQTFSENFDLILSDTEPDIRFAEVVRYMPLLNPGGFLFVHDLHRHLSQHDNQEKGFGWPFGKLPVQISTWLKDDELRVFHFPTPRGLTCFYKPRADDYRWSK